MSQGSMILKLISLPISIILICLGITTILGGHITPGGGFQGGAMIASGPSSWINNHETSARG